jgi:uncharacterized protein YndB with AHSA1/START domain
MTSVIKIDPKLDLVLEREIDVPVELVWKAWTTPSSLKEWFVPKPWSITAVEIDLRPGGIFASTMRSPEGQEFENVGCYLEVVPNQRLVFTDTLLPGYRPLGQAVLHGGPRTDPQRQRHALQGDRHPRQRRDPQEP